MVGEGQDRLSLQGLGGLASLVRLYLLSQTRASSRNILSLYIQADLRKQNMANKGKSNSNGLTKSLLLFLRCAPMPSSIKPSKPQ